MHANPIIWLIVGIMALSAISSLAHQSEGLLWLNLLWPLVQLKSGGIRGMVESQIEPDSDHPKAWVRWDDGNYSVHHEHELRAATVDEPRVYKKLA